MKTTRSSRDLSLFLGVGLVLLAVCSAQYPAPDELVRCYGKVNKNGNCKNPTDNSDPITFLSCCRGGWDLPKPKGYILATLDGECETCPKKRDGRWGGWSPWSLCSASCGSGTRSRRRSCTNPTPLLDGKPCATRRGRPLHIETQSDDCNTDPCPVDGGWTDWSEYSACSVTCDSGEQTKHRSCTNPAPKYGGRPCPGQAKSVRSCVMPRCHVPKEGNFHPWSKFSPCSATCGLGFKTRQRSCTKPQTDRLECIGAFFERHHCFETECRDGPIEGGVISCGVRRRDRTPGNDEASGSGSGSGDENPDGKPVDEEKLLSSGDSDDEDASHAIDFGKCCRRHGMAYDGKGSCCRQCRGPECDLGSGDPEPDPSSGSGSGDSSGSGSGDSDDEDVPRRRHRRSPGSQVCRRIKEATRSFAKPVRAVGVAAVPAGRKRRNVDDALTKLVKISRSDTIQHTPNVPAQRSHDVTVRQTRDEDHSDDDYSDDDFIFTGKP